MKKIIICICLSVGLSSCSIYRTYKRPDVSVVDSLYHQPALSADTTASIADLSWKELFTDSQLQSLIEKGLCNNSDLGIARLADRIVRIEDGKIVE